MKPDPKDPRVRLLHMLEACDRTARLVEDRTREDLDADETLRLALQYLVLTLGEAAKNIPQEIQAKAPGIPWRAVTTDCRNSDCGLSSSTASGCSMKTGLRSGTISQTWWSKRFCLSS